MNLLLVAKALGHIDEFTVVTVPYNQDIWIHVSKVIRGQKIFESLRIPKVLYGNLTADRADIESEIRQMIQNTLEKLEAQSILIVSTQKVG